MAQQQSQQTRKDYRSTVEVLREARRDAATTLEVGNATNVALAAQDEQLDRIDNKLDKIEAELTVSDRILKSMTGFTGMVTSLFGSSKAARPTQEPVQARASTDRPASRSVPPAPAGAKPQRGPTVGLTAEEDDELDGLEADLANIMSVAKAQNETLKAQNRRMDAINDKTSKVNNHFDNTQGKIKRLM